jgi:hypothetical protein
MTAGSGAFSGWFRRKVAAEPSPDADDQATGSTTGGGSSSEPVVVWEAANRMEAEIVVGRLQSEGIPALIQGEALGTIYGLTTGSLAAATVLVPALLADKALELLTTEVDWDIEHETGIDSDHATTARSDDAGDSSGS